MAADSKRWLRLPFTTRRTIKDHEVAKFQLETKLEESANKLRDGVEELGGLRVRIEQAESERVNAFAVRDDIQKNLDRARQDLEKSLKVAAGESQRADLLDKENQRLGSEIGELKRDLREAIERAAKAETRLEILQFDQGKPSPPVNGRSTAKK